MLRNPFKTYRMSSLYMLTFGSFLVLFLILLMGVSYQVTTAYMSKQVSVYQQELLDEVGKRIDAKMTSVEQVALSITRNEALLSYLKNKQADMYSRKLAQQELGYYLSNIVYSWNDVLSSVHVYMHDPLPSVGLPAAFEEMGDLPQEPWYALVNQSDYAWIGEREVAASDQNKQVISFAQKIYSDTNQFIGVLVLGVKPQAVVDSLLNESNQSRGIKRVLMGNGQQMITNAGFMEEDRSWLQDMLQAYYTKPSDLNGRKVERGERYFVTESGDRNAQWQVIQFTPMKGISEDSSRIALMLGAIGVAAILIAYGFTFLFSRQFMKPIMTLKQGMDRFSVDRLKSEMPRDYTNEFGILFRGYDALTERVTELYAHQELQFIKQKELDVKALQAMINPHFLYNTLDQINWMAIEANQPKISEVLELVGKMFRIGLSNGDTIVTVREELAYIGSYLQIQQIRMEPFKLDVAIEVPPELESYAMPKVLLQPIVENAVMHGFHGRESGAVHIRVVEHKEGIAFVVQDNGNGFQPKQDHWPQHQKTIGGYGIRNVEERIEALFGVPYGIQVASEPGEGAAVTVLIPKRDRTSYYR
ncbi:sensor histidine kinase [Paenibacillus paridis]|uniref:sensor histidine kinase n=1 Tax=Paenibacillus paridis TaxID=2583376 RepID=UPI001391AF2D|nr:sensor histidine kinase [Paenibacillus paridis]